MLYAKKNKVYIITLNTQIVTYTIKYPLSHIK